MVGLNMPLHSPNNVLLCLVLASILNKWELFSPNIKTESELVCFPPVHLSHELISLTFNHNTYQNGFVLK